MGVILAGGMAAGFVIGFALTAGTGAAAIFLLLRFVGRRRNVWPVFFPVAGVALLLMIALVQLYPYEAVTPGSDYDIAMKNLFLRGFGYGLAPGVAALAGALASRLAPVKSGDSPGSECHERTV